MDIDKMIDEIDREKESYTRWGNIKFAVYYFFRDIQVNIRSIFTGLGNFWRFREEIYRWRWYDHSFMHNTLKVRLRDMYTNWDYAHYIGSENEKYQLKLLIDILNEIEKLEDECTVEAEKEIDELYQKFGREMFDVKDFIEEHEGQTYTKRHSQFRRFWD